MKIVKPATQPIPSPKPWPIVGNLPDLADSEGLFHLLDMAREFGPIYKLELPGGQDMVFVSTHELVNELCDEVRFTKKVSRLLMEVRNFAGDGLFTAFTDEPNWGAAHRILMPAFGPAALRTMFDQTTDIADQVLVKWERLGPGHQIDIASDATRLTLDTIALCAFSYRFNSMYSDQMHPLVGSMVRLLAESGRRGRRMSLQNRLMLREQHQYDEDIRQMDEIADKLVADRQRQPLPEGQHDILDTMLEAADPKTGERLSAENVRYQLVTFLIAGHETTSGLLTFTLYQLMRFPEILAKAQAHVDQVLGDHEPEYEHLVKLTYIDQILKESLRLWPPAAAFTLQPYEDTVIGGRYAVPKGQSITVLTSALHRDPAVWGDDPERFDPDRFAFDRAKELPPNAWKPFGNGQRSCIGRGFALQEATLFLSKMLQRFDISPVDPDYKLKIKQTLTIKPQDFYITVRRRDKVIISGAAEPKATARNTPVLAATANGIPVRVLYGSNAGTSQAFAQRIVSDARLRGYTSTLDTLDSGAGHLPTEGLVVIVTSSYEGLPPDNARQFVSWVQSLEPGALTGVRFAVFGAGNKDWARTYQAVPKLVDESLAKAGAQRIVPRGEANARGDFFGDFEEWYAGFWTPVATAFHQSAAQPQVSALLQVEFTGAARDTILRRHSLSLGTVVANRELVNMLSPAARSKRHVEIALPDGMTYRCGDYLAVLPLNPPDVVDRALTRFGLTYDATAVLSIGAGGETHLPIGAPVTVGELLSSYVELSQPATRQHMQALSDATVCPPDKKALGALADDADAYTSEILTRRLSVLDLLEKYSACQLSFATFLQMMPPLTPRQYSISSSPKWSADHVTLTVAVLRTPALSGTGTYEGVASNYLSDARPGTKVAVSVRPSNVAFHPPTALSTPIVMVCAGTGLAPFRGFIQDRALRAQEEATKPAPALLFFGCDDPDIDYLYKDELAQWAADGIVDMRPTFSTKPVAGNKYVQDRLWSDRADITALVRDHGATFFVCGDGRHMAPAVWDACVRIYREGAGVDEDAAQAWLTQMQREQSRYVADVFA